MVCVREWDKKAACARLPVDIFFSEDPRLLVTALKVCLECQVVAECLEYACSDESSLRNGVYGCSSAKTRYRKLYKAHRKEQVPWPVLADRAKDIAREYIQKQEVKVASE